MGIEKDALVNQALHLFAHLHGYLARAPAGTGSPFDVGLPLPVTSPAIDPGEDLERRTVAEEVLETAARLEEAMWSPRSPDAAALCLILVKADGTEQTIRKDRFVIGRGRHCDLVVENSKVSREHVALIHEDGSWYIEDLGSSNGTWFQHDPIARRRIEDGDEYLVCSEPFRFVLR